jgi:hypothetical protein
MTAFGGTAAVFAVLASVATVSKRDFSGMGTWLFAGVVILLLASIANIFLQIPALAIVISVVAIAIFSAYILYDVQQIVNGGETNYIRATLASTWTCTTSSPTCCPCWASSAATATKRSLLHPKPASRRLFYCVLSSRSAHGVIPPSSDARSATSISCAICARSQ